MESSEIRRVIGKRIAIARNAAGINQDELADAVGVHKQTISRWENGKRAPNGEEIRLIAKITNCSADFVLGLSDTFTVKQGSEGVDQSTH